MALPPAFSAFFSPPATGLPLPSLKEPARPVPFTWITSPLSIALAMAFLRDFFGRSGLSDMIIVLMAFEEQTPFPSPHILMASTMASVTLGLAREPPLASLERASSDRKSVV